MPRYLKKAQFSKPRLAVFAIAFALIGFLIFRSFAAPNPSLPGDLNNDNAVNITDMSILLSDYNTSNTAADINADGTVNVLDLSILLSNYGKTYTANNVNCSDSSAVWQSAQFAPAGTVTASFYATPSATGDNLVAGFSSSAAADYTSLATIVRFNPANTIDARNGGTYAALNSVAYVSGQSYYFELFINSTNHTYAAYVTPASGARVQIADNYAFRTEQATASSMAYFNIYGEAGTMHVCNPMVNGKSITFAARSGGGAVSCTTIITNSTNLLNTYNAAHPGDTICLGPGVTIDQGQVDFRNAIGTSTAPITITSADPTNPGEIYGRVVTHPPANYIVFSHLKFDYVSLSTPPNITVGSDHITLSRNDITNEDTNICINTIDDPTYGTAHYTVIDANRIHDCGSTAPNHINTDHGIYDIGYYSAITNNFIYNNVARGIQLRQDHNATVKYNVSDSNGEGIIIGDTDVAALNDEVAYNIFSNSNARYNIEYFWSPGPPANANNIIHDNCVWPSNSDSSYNVNGGVLLPFVGATVTNTKTANPSYVNAAAKDFHLQAGSPCIGYGVQTGVTPGT